MRLFKNATEKVMNFKINGEWVVINPEEVIELPSHADESRQGLVAVEDGLSKVIKESPKKKEEPDLKTEADLKQLTKDELNDYAYSIGLEEVNTRMKKSEMISAILQG